LRLPRRGWQALAVPACEKGAKGKIRDFDKKVSQETGMNTVQGSKLAPSIFIGRWTPKILFSLKERPYRHGQLRRHLGSVSQRMLTRTLRTLESAGLIAKRVTKSKTIAVEYSLTQLGRTLIAPLRGMCRWAKRYGRDVSAEVHLRGAETA
jgi:DNA-binding HxlR family transcriptional regulator